MPSSPPGPGDEDLPLRERKRRNTRRAILEAVAELELVHGGAVDPSIVTYARIAEVAGVSERTVYRFFPTKGDLDEAYAAEMPVGLGVEMPKGFSVDRYPEVIEEIGQRWAQRTGDVRIDDHELETDVYWQSYAARQARDEALIEQLFASVPELANLGPNQQRALTAAIHSTVSIRTIAITAQRWNLTIAEAATAHAWTLRRLLESLAADPPEPWEDDHA